jgi:hypothetical protein
MLRRLSSGPVVRLALLSVAIAATEVAQGQVRDLDTRLMLSTILLSHPDSTATAFVLTRPAPGRPGQTQFVLITAGHALSQVKGETTTAVFRKIEADGSYSKCPQQLVLRQGGKDLWTKHPDADVAVMVVSAAGDVVLPCVSTDLLASDADLTRWQIHPGDEVRCLGYPHAAQFAPGPDGFGVVRRGCIASYPLLPATKHRTFIADVNTFEGDSGSPIYLAEHSRYVAGRPGPGQAELILGLVVAQQFIDERFTQIYESGLFRHRLGLAIVVNSQTIRETIELMDGKGKR